MRKIRWDYVYVIFILFFILGLSLYFNKYGMIVNHYNTKDEAIRNALVNEYEKINHLPGVTLVDSKRLIRNGSGFVGYGFSTITSNEEILEFYGSQLKENGWVFEKEEEVKYAGSESYVRRAVYKKEDYVAYIGYGYNQKEWGNIRFSITFEKPVK